MLNAPLHVFGNPEVSIEALNFQANLVDEHGVDPDVQRVQCWIFDCGRLDAQVSTKDCGPIKQCLGG